MKKIEPAAARKNKEVNPAIEENLRHVKDCILENSPEVKKAVDEGRVKLVLAKYLMETGEVKVLE